MLSVREIGYGAHLRQGSELMYRVLLLLGAFVLISAETTTAYAVETCRASWYQSGTKTANGTPFNANDASIVAHKSLPFGTTIRIKNLGNGRSLTAKVLDRGPFIAGRCVDVTRAGADALGFRNAGTAKVEVRVLN